MTRTIGRGRFVLAALAAAALASPAAAQTVHAPMSSYQEVPALSSPARGHFRAHIDQNAGSI